MQTVLLGVGMFTFVVVALVGLLLLARKALVTTGKVKIVINNKDDQAMQVEAGSTLLSTLSAQKLFIPSACGGGGTCGVCLVTIDEGGGNLLPTEETHINRGMARQGLRLSCQVKVKQDMRIRIPESLFSVKKWECTVVSNHNVATFIKEFKVRLPEGETIAFTSGDYIQIEIPPYACSYADFEVEPQYRDEWDRYEMWRYRAKNDETVERAYSMANYPDEGSDLVMLNVRIASPPPHPPVPPNCP